MKQQWGIVKTIKDYLGVILFLLSIALSAGGIMWRIGSLESRMEKIESTVQQISSSVYKIEGYLEGKNLTLKQ